MTTLNQEFSLLAQDSACAHAELQTARLAARKAIRLAVASKISEGYSPESAADHAEYAELFESSMRDWPISRVLSML